MVGLCEDSARTILRDEINLNERTDRRTCSPNEFVKRRSPYYKYIEKFALEALAHSVSGKTDLVEANIPPPTANLESLPGYVFKNGIHRETTKLNDNVKNRFSPCLDVNDSGIDITCTPELKQQNCVDNSKMVASTICDNSRLANGVGNGIPVFQNGVAPARGMKCFAPIGLSETNRPQHLNIRSMEENSIQNSTQNPTDRTGKINFSRFTRFGKPDLTRSSMSCVKSDGVENFQKTEVRRSWSEGTAPWASEDRSKAPHITNTTSHVTNSPAILASSGYDSDSLKVCEAEIDNIFQKSNPDMKPCTGSNTDREHSDFFSLSETYPVSNGVCNEPHTGAEAPLLSSHDEKRLNDTTVNDPQRSAEQEHNTDAHCYFELEKSPQFSDTQINNYRLTKVARCMFDIIEDLKLKDSDSENEKRPKKSKQSPLQKETTKQVSGFEKTGLLPCSQTDKSSPHSSCNVSSRVTNGALPSNKRIRSSPTAMGLCSSEFHVLNGSKQSKTSFHPNMWLFESEPYTPEPNATCKIDFKNLLEDLGRLGPHGRVSNQQGRLITRKPSPFLKTSSPVDSLERLSIRATNIRATPPNSQETRADDMRPSSSSPLICASSTARETDDPNHVYETIPGDMDYEELEQLRQNGLLPRLTKVPNLPGTFVPETPPQLPERRYRDRHECNSPASAELTRKNSAFVLVKRPRDLPCIPDETRSEGSGYAKIDDANSSFDSENHNDSQHNSTHSALSRKPLTRSFPEPPRTKRAKAHKRDNLYLLFSNKETRHLLSESLEIETKLQTSGNVSGNIDSNFDNRTDSQASPTTNKPPLRRVKATYV